MQIACSECFVIFKNTDFHCTHFWLFIFIIMFPKPQYKIMKFFRHALLFCNIFTSYSYVSEYLLVLVTFNFTFKKYNHNILNKFMTVLILHNEKHTSLGCLS